ncbi:hypothetical protein BLNAU_10100 [Blattamonas nauphoetae]|uniref:Uncharacterized protein n=1 Tax=Blattamonas nauphoetae TaxID=2049346 RepID=A0ABQ9XU05_9EUKA|nr:hypothetical protein BLNAU_10100 [Blattamonas nauphoetae]
MVNTGRECRKGWKVRERTRAAESESEIRSENDETRAACASNSVERGLKWKPRRRVFLRIPIPFQDSDDTNTSGRVARMAERTTTTSSLSSSLSHSPTTTGFIPKR